jgi:hypothetical protein
VLAVIRHELRHGRMTAELADRASQVVEETAIAVEPEADSALRDLLDSARAEIESSRRVATSGH